MPAPTPAAAATSSFRAISAVARREFSGYFYQAIAYVYLAVFVAAASSVFLAKFLDGNDATASAFFSGLVYVFIFFAPMVAMRAWAEEFGQGTYELLATLPATEWQLVIGKFIAAAGFLAVALGLTAGVPMTVVWAASPDAGANYRGIFETLFKGITVLSAFGVVAFLCVGRSTHAVVSGAVALIATLIAFAAAGDAEVAVDRGAIISGYFGAWLMGCAFIAIGMFGSALTRHQIMALVTGFVICAPFGLLGAPQFRAALTQLPGGGIIREIFGMYVHYESIQRGVLVTADLFYFVSVTAFFLLLTKYALERRRF
jgi:ABC-2 type transport system permease protein